MSIHISFTKQSGSIEIIDGENTCTAILNRFVGSIDSISRSCTYLNIIVRNDSQINSDIKLVPREDKLDTLTIKGPGTLGIGLGKSLEATSVEIESNIKVAHIAGNVVKLTGCTVESIQGPKPQPPVVIPPDKSELQNLVDRFSAFDIDQYFISEDGTDVLITDQWITEQAKEAFQAALEQAIFVLEDDSTTQEVIDQAAADLLAAFDALNPQYGLMILTDKSHLYEAMVQANMALGMYSVSEDGYDIPPDVEWIDPEEDEYLRSKILHAQIIYEDTTVDQDTVDNETQILLYAISNLSPVWGKQIYPERASSELKQELFEKIQECNILLVRYTPSIDGEDVDIDRIWVTWFTYNNLQFTVNVGNIVYEDPDASTIRVGNIMRSLDIAVDSLNPQHGHRITPSNSFGSSLHSTRRILRGPNVLRSDPEDIRFEAFISAKGHAYIVDTTLIVDEGYDYGIASPYILFDNSKSNVEGYESAFDTQNAVSIEHCIDVEYLEKTFVSTSLVNDENGHPKDFLYLVLKDENGKITQIASRRKLYGYNIESLSYIDSGAVVSGNQNIPAQLATPYDKFKHSTQYTNVDLHRWIDQNGELYNGRTPNYITDEVLYLIIHSLWNGESFEWEAIPDEVINAICQGTYIYDGHPHTSEPMDPGVVDAIIHGTYIWPRANGYEWGEINSRQYEVGIYSLNSYRVTDLIMYEADNELCDDREIP